MLTWMAYSTAIGILLGAAALCAELALGRLRRPTRFVWLSAVVLTLGIPALTVSRSAPREDPNRVAIAPLVTGTEPAVARPGPVERSGGARVGIDPGAPSDWVAVDVLLLALWAAGTLTCGLVLVGSAWRISRMSHAWRKRVVAGVPVLVSHDVGPAVIGLVHHGIVLPAWVETLEPDAQRMVLAHEREHVRAGDPLLLWGATALVVFTPWNVALWIALRRLRHAIEIDCDARVLQTGPDPRAYCALLLDVGERTLAGVAPVAALAEPASLLERRIDAMTTTRRGGWRVAATAAAAAVLVLVACRAPHPEVGPRARVVALTQELASLLATDSGRAALDVDGRRRLRASLDAPGVGDLDGGLPGDTAQLRARMAAAHDELSRSQESLALAQRAHQRIGDLIDGLVRSAYPGLVTRNDTSTALLAVVLDTSARVVRHAARSSGAAMGDVATLLRSLRIDTVSTRTRELGILRRPQWHLNVIYAMEGPGPLGGATGLRGTIGTTESSDSIEQGMPALEGYALRLDSLARTRYPEAFRPHDDAVIVAALYTPDGRLVESEVAHFPERALFARDRRSGELRWITTDSEALLTMALTETVPPLTQSGAWTLRAAPRTILVWGLAK